VGPSWRASPSLGSWPRQLSLSPCWSGSHGWCPFDKLRAVSEVEPFSNRGLFPSTKTHAQEGADRGYPPAAPYSGKGARDFAVRIKEHQARLVSYKLEDRPRLSSGVIELQMNVGTEGDQACAHFAERVA